MKSGFDENVRELAKAARGAGKKKFALQLPEGLKTKAMEIIAALEKEGFEIIYAAEPCYGACDLALEELESGWAECLIHVGHSKFYREIRADFPVIYFPWKIDIDFDGMDFSAISEKKIGLVTTIQHADAMEKAKTEIEKHGKEAIIGGQILGCNAAAAGKIENEVDAFLFIGSGNFHPLALKGGKKVYVMNMEKGAIEVMDTAMAEKKRWASIFRARGAKSFGILVSTKPGQKELQGKAEEIKERLKKEQKEAEVIMMDEITDQKLFGIGVDAFINTACPRLAEDSFSRPVVNAADLEELLKE